MNNTQQRILSAIVMVLIILFFSLFKVLGMKLLLLLCGALLVDEAIVKMLKVSRREFSYVFSITTFFIGFIFFNFINIQSENFIGATYSAVVINIALLIYLYFEKMGSSTVIEGLKKMSFLIGLLFLFPFLSLSYLLTQPNWSILVIFLLVLNFSVDTGAWFFGRRFGKNKLWPSISPKKTREGAIGGAIFATIIGSLISSFYLERLSFLLVLCFVVISVMAQLGDLIESKFKRQLGVKDSSNLIPGHGGIYDRIDSLIYVAPLFVMVIKYFY